MLARSRGVPAIVCLGIDLTELVGHALVDAHRGVLIVNPGADARRQFQHDARSASTARARADAAALRPAVTLDGTPYIVVGVLNADFRFPRHEQFGALVPLPDRLDVVRPAAFVADERENVGHSERTLKM